MSQENVEIVRRGFEAFQRGGPEALLELFSDNVGIYRAQPDLGRLRHGSAILAHRGRGRAVLDAP